MHRDDKENNRAHNRIHFDWGNKKNMTAVFYLSELRIEMAKFNF